MEGLDVILIIVAPGLLFGLWVVTTEAWQPRIQWKEWRSSWK
jgi:hypothetical protein